MTRGYENALCGRCGLFLKMVHRSPVCRRCYEVVLCVAREQQEASYLANWLSTRADDRSPTAARLRQVAEAERIDWTKPPKPVAFVDRLHTLMAPFRAQLMLVEAIA